MEDTLVQAQVQCREDSWWDYIGLGGQKCSVGISIGGTELDTIKSAELALLAIKRDQCLSESFESKEYQSERRKIEDLYGKGLSSATPEEQMARNISKADALKALDRQTFEKCLASLKIDPASNDHAVIPYLNGKELEGKGLTISDLEEQKEEGTVVEPAPETKGQGSKATPSEDNKPTSPAKPQDEGKEAFDAMLKRLEGR